MTELDFATASLGTDHSSSHEYIPKDLICSHVWIRVDRVQRPLEAPYRGPLRVLHRSAKTFRVELPSGAVDTVSVDRLKPAHFPSPEDDFHGHTAAQQGHQLDPDISSTVLTPRSPSGLQEASINDFGPQQEPIRTRSGRIVCFRAEPDFVYI